MSALRSIVKQKQRRQIAGRTQLKYRSEGREVGGPTAINTAVWPEHYPVLWTGAVASAFEKAHSQMASGVDSEDVPEGVAGHREKASVKRPVIRTHQALRTSELSVEIVDDLEIARAAS